MSHKLTPEEERREAARDHQKSLTGKVFDTDSRPIQARLLVWGPEEVDGEDCIIAEPTDFFWTAPNRHYDGQDRPGIAADDLRIAIPIGCFPPSDARAALAEIAAVAEEGANSVLVGTAKERFDLIREKARAAWTGSYEDDDPGEPDHCPKCGSEAITQMTDPDGDWACLDCGAKFFADDPDRFEAEPERPDPRRDEESQATLDAGISSVHARDPARRKALKGMRLDWLRSEGWDMQAGDYERGEVTLTELLRRLNDEPAVVEQIATWLEEDAAETDLGESPYTVFGFHKSAGESFAVDVVAVSKRHAQAKARAWARGLEEGGEIVVATVSEAYRP